MRIEESPVKTMAKIMYVLEPSGKLRARFAADQFSRKSEATRSTGRDRRLL